MRTNLIKVRAHRRRPGSGLLPVRQGEHTPHLQRAAVQAAGPREPDHSELDCGHGRVIRRSIWVAEAAGLDFPGAARVARIRRDGYDCDGQLVSKEVVHAASTT